MGLWIVIYTVHPPSADLSPDKNIRSMKGIRGSVPFAHFGLGQKMPFGFDGEARRRTSAAQRTRVPASRLPCVQVLPGRLTLLLVVLFGRLEARRISTICRRRRTRSGRCSRRCLARPGRSSQIEFRPGTLPISIPRPGANIRPAQSEIKAGRSPAPPPMNVLMVVMESVGVRRLEFYGAPYHDSPNLIRLASHGMLFQRIYRLNR